MRFPKWTRKFVLTMETVVDFGEEYWKPVGVKILKSVFSSPILYMLLFSVFPIVELWSSNVNQIRASDTLNAFLIALAFGSTGILLWKLITKSWHSSAIITSFFIGLFASYGHIYNFIEGQAVFGFTVGRHRFLLPLWILLAVSGSYLTLKKIKQTESITVYLNICAIVLVLQPITQVATYYIDQIGVTALEQEDLGFVQGIEKGFNKNDLPNIYYIITDAYARTDILSERYDYDNSSFIRYLTDQGFFVAEESSTNYLWTHLSLSSTLNMNYIPDILPDWENGDPVPSVQLIHDSIVRRRLESLGYKTVGFATGWEGSELFDADVVLTPDMMKYQMLESSGVINDFEGMLLSTTLIKALIDLDSVVHTPIDDYVRERLAHRFAVQRGTILGLIDNLQRTPSLEGPIFVFAHILSPHGPMIFGPNGEAVENDGPFTLDVPIDLPGGQHGERYLDQLTYITKRLQETIEVLLAESERDVIIILQSDHGPGGGLNWDHPTKAALKDKQAIINAYYVPHACQSSLYDSITPVNSFRVIFNCVFENTFPLLEDKTYFGIEFFIPLDEFYEDALDSNEE